ncbi:putative reverse transcriptase domain-containing protein, partial [Tanacetum coccineum]
CLAWMLLIDLCEVYLPVPVYKDLSMSSNTRGDTATQTDTPVIPTETPIIAPTIPPSPDYTPASPDYSPASDSESDPSEDPSSDHIPPLPATSPFLSSDDDSTDSDTPDTPSSPTHDTPFTEITASTQRSPIIPRRRVMLLASGQPIPYGRPYRYHLNGPVHMMTARKRVGPLPTHRLAVRHSTDHSSSDSSSEASSDFHSDASSDSSSRHPLSDHSSPDLSSTSTGPSRKRRRSFMTSVPALSPVSEALSPVHADLIPSPKRVRDFGYSIDVEVDHRETSLRDDVIVRVNALRDRGIDARVVVEAIDRDETETGVRGPVEVRVERVTHPAMPEDIPEPAQEGAVEATYETLGDLVQRIVKVESAVIALIERIAELERDNKRLKGTASVESQRVDRLQRGMSRMQRELRQMRRLQFYDRVRVGRLEAKMPSTRSGASMTREEFEEMVTRRVAEEMEAREAARTLEPLNENGDELEGENGGNGNGGNRGNGNGGNGGNGNGNRNGNHGMNYGGFMPVARECTFQDFLKCKPHNFSGTEGVVGLTRWFEKMETVFNISNCPSKYQVKYATCTLQDSALTWWNSHKRTIGVEAAYAMNWVELMKLMTEVYCPRNEIQKMETELMVPDEETERKVSWSLPDNIQGTVIAGKIQPDSQDAIKRTHANHLMDKKSRLPPFKRQNTSGQNVARAYTAGNNEKRGYVGPLPYCNKCRMHHEGLCTMRCGNFEESEPWKPDKKQEWKQDWKPDWSKVLRESLLIVKEEQTLIPTLSRNLPIGRISETNIVLRGCTLGLLGHPFDIDLMPIELGSFDVIIGMDWLAKYHALIVCDEKVVRIPYGNEVLIIRGDNYDSGKRHEGHRTKFLSLIEVKGITLIPAKIEGHIKRLGVTQDTHRDSSILSLNGKKAETDPVLKAKVMYAPILALPGGSETSWYIAGCSHKGVGRRFDAE